MNHQEPHVFASSERAAEAPQAAQAYTPVHHPPVAPAPVAEAPVSMNDAPFDPKAGLVPRSFGQLMKLAEIFSRSQLVPAHFRGKPDDCFVALQMAYRMELDPMTALQNIYIVSGKPGLSGALVIALINRSGKIKGPLRFRVEGKGDTLQVTAYGELREGGEVDYTIPWSMVKAENWDKNPKYKSMPDVMMRYRAATFFARFFMPDVIIGMHTAEEWEDIAAAENATIQRTTGERIGGPEPEMINVSETAQALRERAARRALAEPQAETAQ